MQPTELPELPHDKSTLNFSNVFRLSQDKVKFIGTTHVATMTMTMKECPI